MTPAADVSVRPARAQDAPRIAAVQLRAWRAAYADLLPAAALDLDAEEVAEGWRAAADSPPSQRHHVLVACEGTEVVGLVAVGPAEDPDSDPTDADLGTLLVDPGHTGAGHGSRLLTAAVETLREHGFVRAQAWLLAADDVLRRFLTSAGWAPDGSTRDLEVPDLPATGAPGEPTRVHQVRLHTDLSDDPSAGG